MLVSKKRYNFSLISLRTTFSGLFSFLAYFQLSAKCSIEIYRIKQHFISTHVVHILLYHVIFNIFSIRSSIVYEKFCILNTSSILI